MPPLSKKDAYALVKQRHPEWVEHQERWRWLLDSLEGGERYRHADYFRGPFEERVTPYAFGWDNATGEGFPMTFNQIVKRNLIPHLSEMSVQARDIYTLRLHRTPVPALVEFVARRYLSRIFARQITRKGGKALETWWEDVDGLGTEIGQWVRKTVGPMLLTLGFIDLVFGHPEAEEGGAEVLTRADQKRLGLDGCVASYILPENMVWWKTSRGKYLQCLVHERDENGETCWRHWIGEESNAYDGVGEYLPDESWTHTFGRVPIVRVFDDRNLRCRHTGKSRMELVAELQKSIYNRRSELILGDILHSHPLLQGPEDYAQSDGKISVGPGGMLPMRKLDTGTGYGEFNYLDPPQSGADACREHIQDDLDEVMSHSALLKPAGMVEGSTVAQSGVSKNFDAREGNDLLSEIAETLEEAEEVAAAFALAVLTDGTASEADVEAIEVVYPREFELFTATDLAGVLVDIQMIATSAGELPETEGEVLKRLISVLLPGLDPERMGELHAEVEAVMAAKSTAKDQEAEARAALAAGATEHSTEDPSITLPPDAGMAAEALNTVLAPEIV